MKKIDKYFLSVLIWSIIVWAILGSPGTSPVLTIPIIFLWISVTILNGFLKNKIE